MRTIVTMLRRAGFASQETCSRLAQEIVMRTLIVVVAALAIASTAFAQQKRTARDVMNDMKAKYGETFERCQSLAISRGHSLRDDSVEVGASEPFMMFIEGCIMGQQR
jgi:hypothetical protein